MNSNSTFIVDVMSLEIFVAHLYYITGHSIFLFAKSGSPVSATHPHLHYLKKKKKTGPGHKPRVFNSEATTTPDPAMGVFLSLPMPSITLPALCA